MVNCMKRCNLHPLPEGGGRVRRKWASIYSDRTNNEMLAWVTKPLAARLRKILKSPCFSQCTRNIPRRRPLVLASLGESSSPLPRLPCSPPQSIQQGHRPRNPLTSHQLSL